jgi:hypothetical protein
VRWLFLIIVLGLFGIERHTTIINSFDARSLACSVFLRGKEPWKVVLFLNRMNFLVTLFFFLASKCQTSCLLLEERKSVYTCLGTVVLGFLFESVAYTNTLLLSRGAVDEGFGRGYSRDLYASCSVFGMWIALSVWLHLEIEW